MVQRNGRRACGRERRWPWVLAAALAAVLTFAPTLGHGFVNWDDPDLILENPRVTAGAPLEALSPGGHAWLPVRDLAWSLTWRLAGPSPLAFHLLNVACHAAATALFVLLVGELLGGAPAVAGAAGLVFAVHPLHVEPVAWASGLKDPLSAGLMFGAFLLYVRATRADGVGRRLAATAGALGLLWCAALAKASALVLPGLMALYALTAARDRRRALAAIVPFAVLALLLGWVAYDVASASGAVKVRTASAGRVAANAAAVAAAYLRRAVLPVGLSPRYGGGAAVGPAVLAAGAYAALVAVAARRRRRLCLALGWFGVALLPYLHAVRTSTAEADRYVYVAVGGWAMCLGLAGEALVGARRRRLAVGLVAAVVAAYAAGSVWQSRVWASSERLWRRAVAVAPGDSVAHYLLAEAIWEERPLAGALHFARAAEPRLASAGRHRAAAAQARERGADGLAARHEALAREQRGLAAEALAYAGTAYRRSGKPDAAARAEGAFRRALELSGGEPRDHYLLARHLADLGRIGEAAGHFLIAARRAPGLRGAVLDDLDAIVRRAAEAGEPEAARPAAEALRRLGRPPPPRALDRGAGDH